MVEEDAWGQITANPLIFIAAGTLGFGRENMCKPYVYLGPLKFLDPSNSWTSQISWPSNVDTWRFTFIPGNYKRRPTPWTHSSWSSNP